MAVAITTGAAAASSELDSEAPATRRFSDVGWMEEARTLAVGQSLRLAQMELEGMGVQQATLRRVRVFTADASIAVHGDAGVREIPAPDNIYLSGALDGRSGSRVVLSVSASGKLRGVAAENGRHWIFGSLGSGADAAVQATVRAATLAALVDGHDGFRCELGGATTLAVDDLRAPEESAQGADVGRDTPPVKAAASHTARIAIESDFEYFQKFGNSTDAADYAADLIAYTSSIYVDELATSMLISHISLWETSADPWTQTSSLCGLYDFGRYWNDNHGGIPRTTGYFVSGKSSNSGIAWVGVLCQGAFNTSHGGSCPALTPEVDNYGGAYAYVSGIDGNFNPDSPSVLWDIVATAHELGHNFNSPHTHCYAGLEGNASPIDECYAGQCGSSGCHCGSTSLPCGQIGAGCGTIMSYCHLLSGGMSNLTLTLGTGHPHGIAPERVPLRMSNHVVARAASYPGCLDLIVPNLIFDDGFESGNMRNWTTEAP